MTAAVAATTTPRGDRTGIIALTVAEAISTLGTRISFLAIPWLILVTSHDPVRIGIVAGSSSVPYVLNGFIASPLVDKIGARRMSIISDVASAFLMAGVALFYNSGIVVIALIVAVAGAFRGVGDRAKNTMLKPMMDASGIDAMRVTSAWQGTTQLAQLAGGSVAGVLIALYNPWGVIWIDVVSYVVCALIVVTLVVMPPDPAKAKPQLEVVDGVYVSASARDTGPEPKGEPYLAQLGAAFTFLRHDRLISAMVGMLFVTNLFAQVGNVTFIPLWIDSRLDHSPVALGWISGAYALGTIAGNALFTALAPKLPRYKMFVAGYFLGGMPRFLVFAFTDNLAVVVAVWAFAGFALSSANPTIGAVMYQRIPVALLARVGALSSALAFLGFSVGGVVGGLSVEKMGFTAAVLFASVIYFCATLTPVFGYPTWKLIDTVSRPVRKLATDAKITIRLVLTGQQWTVSARRRDGAPLVKNHPVAPDRVTHALWLLNPPELQTTVTAMLAHEQSEARAREHALRADLAAAERRLAQVTLAATATALGAGSLVEEIVDAAAGISGLASGAAETEGAPVPEIIAPRAPDDTTALPNGNGHRAHSAVPPTAEFSLTRPEDDVRRTT